MISTYEETISSFVLLSSNLYVFCKVVNDIFFAFSDISFYLFNSDPSSGIKFCTVFNLKYCSFCYLPFSLNTYQLTWYCFSQYIFIFHFYFKEYYICNGYSFISLLKILEINFVSK